MVASSVLSPAPHGWRVARRFTRIDMAAPDNHLDTEWEGIMYFESVAEAGVGHWYGRDISETVRERLEEGALEGQAWDQYGIAMALLRGEDHCVANNVSAGLAFLEKAAVERSPEDFDLCTWRFGGSLYSSALAIIELYHHYGREHPDERHLSMHMMEKYVSCLEKLLELHVPRCPVRLRSEETVLSKLKSGSVLLMHYYHHTDLAKSTMYARKGADLGDMRCQFGLGNAMASQDNTSPFNFGEAKRWFSKAAEQGLAEAVNAMITLCYHIKDTRDDATAVGWVQRARDDPDRYLTSADIRDCVRVMHGRAHLHGLGTQPKDIKKAIKLFRRPITSLSACELATCHFAGIGVQRDRNKARKYIDRCFTESCELFEAVEEPSVTVETLRVTCKYMQLRLELHEQSQVEIFEMVYRSYAGKQSGHLRYRDILRCEECRRDDARFRCRGCLVARYCSVECQLRGWREGEHKKECPMNFPCARCVRKEETFVHLTDCACEARAARRRLRRRQNSAATTGDIDASPAA